MCESRNVQYNLFDSPITTEINKILKKYGFGKVEYIEYTNRFNEDKPELYIDLVAYTDLDLFSIDYAYDNFTIMHSRMKQHRLSSARALTISGQLSQMAKCVDELNNLDINGMLKTITANKE